MWGVTHVPKSPTWGADLLFSVVQIHHFTGIKITDSVQIPPTSSIRYTQQITIWTPTRFHEIHSCLSTNFLRIVDYEAILASHDISSPYLCVVPRHVGMVPL